MVSSELAQRLARAARFRNLVVHAYAELDLRRVFFVATNGPADLRAFLGRCATTPAETVITRCARTTLR